ncbi:hypothetical protein [Paenibacillus campi]|uniref:hypothetical protein n=1 Tax=Paenibacillus campi TaxID=3106031 RepID=UPI002AFDCA63|nr:hypothetical protein [Paenibacillus sp. SGZ-1009]
MSTALLQEVYQEARRLYVAGSELATDDFRLNRLLPKLQQLGERSPVFKRIGDGVAALVAGTSSTGDDADSAAQLQRLTLLVLAVLRTQGNTTSEAEGAVPLSNDATALRTRLTYRQLAPVQQALTTTGSGRLEIVEHAWKEGYFDDLRLLPLAMSALADPYTEIAELAMNRIVPGYGETILPYLLNDFDPQGGKLDVRKMKAIQLIAGATHADFYYRIAETGKGDMKAAAIAGLAGVEHYTPSLLEWSNDKKKEVRAAVYEALAQSNSPQAQNMLYTNFTESSRDVEMVVQALCKAMQPELAERLHAAAWEALKLVASQPLDDATRERYTAQLQAYFHVWQQYDRDALLDMYRFVVRHPEPFENMVLSGDSYYKTTLLRPPAYELAHLGNDEDVELLYALQDRYPHYIIAATIAAYRFRSPVEMYERFSKGLGAGSVRGGRSATPNSKRMFEWMEEQLVARHDEEVELLYIDGEFHRYPLWFHVPLSLEQLQQRWDPRWLNIALAHRQELLVAALARPGATEAEEILRQALVERGNFSHQNTGLYFRALDRIGITLDDMRELFWDMMESPKGGASSTIDPFIMRLICRFPAQDIERLEQLIPDSDVKSAGKLRYAAASQMRAVINQMKEMKA